MVFRTETELEPEYWLVISTLLPSGVMATAEGCPPRPLLTVVTPNVEVLMTERVSLYIFATNAFVPSGVMAMP